MGAAELQFDHLAFPSFDAGETYRFYTQVMGFRLTFAFAGQSMEWGNKPYLMTEFRRGGAAITFFDLDGAPRPPDDGLPRDIRHVALSVRSRSEIAVWKKRLRAHRVTYWVEDHDGVPSLYFSDPNGVTIEVTCHRLARFAPRVAAEGVEVVRHWAAARGQRVPVQTKEGKR